MKKEDKKMERRYDKFAIASFVLSLFLLLSFLSFFVTDILEFVFFSYIHIALISIIFGVVGLIRIKKNHTLKGKIYCILGIIINILILPIFIYIISLGSP